MLPKLPQGPIKKFPEGTSGGVSLDKRCHYFNNLFWHQFYKIFSDQLLNHVPKYFEQRTIILLPIIAIKIMHLTDKKYEMCFDIIIVIILKKKFDKLKIVETNSKFLDEC